jgi:rhamnosyltransferase
MQVAGVIILYHPDEEQVIQNIQSYITFIDQLVVFDNSGCSQQFVEKIKSLDPKINFIANSQNEGIARPLNKAFQLLADKYTWILTMDQDSFFEPGQARAYFDSFDKQFYHAEKVAVVSPNPDSVNDISSTSAKEVMTAITSGSLVHTGIWKQLKGFDEKLFIDYVDLEYCYRSIIGGYKIIQLPAIRLNHSIGTKTQAGYLSVIKKSTRHIHSPFRVYYMVRNYYYVSGRYKKLLPQEIKQRRKALLVELKNDLFFSGKFFRVLAAALKGYWHYKLNRFSS